MTQLVNDLIAQALAKENLSDSAKPAWPVVAEVSETVYRDTTQS